MMHGPISLEKLSLFFPNKICFESFCAQILYGSRITIIGNNGSGKSALIKMLLGIIKPSQGQIYLPYDAVFGYVPQIITEYDNLSGGYKFNKALTQALAKDPNILVLDEPTNHLDSKNRHSLIKILKKFPGTIIIASHDVKLLRDFTSNIWHIEHCKINTFSGSYDTYIDELNKRQAAKLIKLEALHKAKNRILKAQQFEQKRAAKSRRVNKNENDRKLKGFLKEKGSRSSSKSYGRINTLKIEISEELSQITIPKVIYPKFRLTSSKISLKNIVCINHGTCGYHAKHILKDISLSLMPQERIAIIGENGSGKSTLVKAVLNKTDIIKVGSWLTPKPEDIGYFDQNYDGLFADKTVFEIIQSSVQAWTDDEIRKHLNNFLFLKAEEITALANTLSGGEKVRLLLAKIATVTPSLLILDEVTNNLDLDTRKHVIQTLTNYPGAMIIISHDEDFLKAINIESIYQINPKNQSLHYVKNLKLDDL